MSTTIDQKVVEMRFDSSNFEKNVSSSLGLLDKLKNALKFKNAADGLEGLEKGLGKLDSAPISGIGTALDAVSGKFSSLEQIAIGALRRIGEQAIDAGAKLIQSLSTDQIAAGFEKFGGKTTSVATLSAQGYALEEINSQLDRLNWFTDETSYNFTDMVNNIAKFTASGQGLTDSVTAMEGIATWAALSGQNANTASRAMYQISQAMGAGIMRKEDYKSIQNASMDTAEFRQKAIEAAIARGTLEEVEKGVYRSTVASYSDKAIEAGKDRWTVNQFADNLTEGQWFTADVMMDVFNAYSSAVDDIYAYQKAHGLDTASEAIEAMGGSVDEFGLKAFKAAQEARTFTDVIDSLKDAASTSWMNIFETIIGGYDEAKTLFTDMANYFYDWFATPINNLGDGLFGAFASGWDQFLKIGIADSAAYENILTALAKERGVNIDDLIEEYGSFSGSLKSGWLSADLLSSGIDELTDKLVGADAELLKTYGLTKNDVEMMSAFRDEVHDGTVDLSYFTDVMARDNTGRELLWKSFWNITESVNNLIEAVKAALPEINSEAIYGALEKLVEFTEKLKDNEKVADRLTRIVTGLGSTFGILSKAFKMVRKALRPVANLIGKALDAAGEGLAIAGDWLVNLEKTIDELGIFDKIADDVSSVLQSIIDFLGGTAKKAVDRFSESGNWLSGILSATVGAFSDLFGALKNMPGPLGAISEGFQKVSEWAAELIRNFTGINTENGDGGIIGFFSNLGEIVSGLAKNIGEFFTNFVGGVASLFSETEGEKTIDIFQMLADALGNVGNAINTIINGGEKGGGIAGLLENTRNAIVRFVPSVIETINTLLDTLTENISGLVHSGVGFVTAFVTSVASEIVANKDTILGILDVLLEGGILVLIANFITKLTTMLPTKLFEDIVDGFSDIASAIQRRIDAGAFLKFAEAVGLLTASMWALSKIPADRIKDSLSALVTEMVSLIAALGGLSVFSALPTGLSATFKLDKGFSAGTTTAISTLASALFSIGKSMILMSIATKILASIDVEKAIYALRGIVILMGLLMGETLAIAIAAAGKMEGLGAALKAIGSSILRMVAAVALLALLNEDAFKSGFERLTGLMTLLAIFGIAVGMLMPQINKALPALASLTWVLIGMISAVAFLSAVAAIAGDNFDTAVDVMMSLMMSIAVISAVFGFFDSKISFKGKGLITLSGALILAAFAFIPIAIAISILSSALKDLTATETQNLITTIELVGLLILGILTVIAFITGGKINRDNNVNKIKNTINLTGLTLLGIASVIISIVGSILLIANYLDKQTDLKNFGIAIGVIVGVLLSISAMMYILGKIKMEKATISMGMLFSFAVLIGVIGGTITAMATAFANIGDPAAAIIASAAVILLVLAIAGAMQQLSNLTFENPKNILAPLIAFGVMVIALGGAIAGLAWLIKEIGDPAAVWASFGIIAVFIVGLTAVMTYLDRLEFSNSGNLVKVLAIFAIVIVALGAAVAGLAYIFSSVGFWAAGGAIVTIVGLIAAMALVMKRLSTIQFTNSGNVLMMLGGFALVIVALSACLAGLAYMMTICPPGAMFGAFAAVVVLGALLLGAIFVLSKLSFPNVDGAIATIVGFGLVLTALIAMMALLAVINMQEGGDTAIWTALLQIGAAIVVLAGAIIVLSAVAGPLEALGKAFEGFGISAMGIGIVILALLAILIVMSIVGPEVVAETMQKFLDFIGAFIGPLVSIIVKTFVTVLYTLAAWVGPIIDSVVVLVIAIIDGVADAIYEHADEIVDAVGKIVNAIITLVLKLFGIDGEDCQFITGVLETIWNALGTGITLIFEGIAAFFQLVGDAVGWLWSLVTGGDTKAAGDELIKNSNRWNDKMANTAQKFVKKASNNMAETTTDATVEGVKEGLKRSEKSVRNDAGQYIGAAAVNGVNETVTTFTGQEAIHNMTMGMEVEMYRTKPALKKNSEGTGNAIFDGLGSVLNANSGKSVVSNLTEGMTGQFDVMGDVIPALGTGVSTETLGNFGEILSFDNGDSIVSSFMGGQTSGITSGGSSVKSASELMAHETYNGANKWLGYSSGTTIGANFPLGILAGISNPGIRRILINSSMEIASILSTTARKTLDEHSPSKVGEDIGANFDAGIIIGLNLLALKVKDASENVGNGAIEGASAALNDLSSVIADDIDTGPTITPVLDLSDVRAGANKISGLFGSTRSFKMAYDAAEASYGKVSMQSLINGLRDDLETVLDGNNNENVVTAVRELRGDINELNNNISNTKIVLDDGTLVGKMAGKMDSALGARVRLSRRGV